MDSSSCQKGMTSFIGGCVNVVQGGGGAYPSTDFLHSIDIDDALWQDTYNGTVTDTRTSVDMRGYVVCKWEETIGCL